MAGVSEILSHCTYVFDLRSDGNLYRSCIKNVITFLSCESNVRPFGLSFTIIFNMVQLLVEAISQLHLI